VALMAALDLTPQGYVLYTIARYGMCLAVMLPATFCAGMTLPLITRVLIGTSDGERAVGLVYGVNTLGSILGVGLAALALLPLIGLKALLFAGAALDMTLGVWVLAAGGARLSPRRSPAFVAAGGAVLLLLGAAWLARFDRVLLTSGVFRARRLASPGAVRVIFYRDGLTATVSASLVLPGTILLATNGKADASLDQVWLNPPPGMRQRVFSRDGATQTLLALITLAHAPRLPQSRTAAVIGQGSGMSSHLLLGDPRFARVTTIEIEPAMIAGSNAFYPANRRVFEDPRSHFAIEDARAYLAAGGGGYDLILSEPSNPWVSGVSGLFTVEFYDQIRRHLSEDGVFGQWLHLYEMNDALLLRVLAALHRTFGSYALYYTSNSDVLVVASRRAALATPDWSVVRQPAIAADLARFIPLTPQTLDALRLADRATLAPLLETSVPPNSDYFPALDLGAERERYLAHTAQGFVTLTIKRFDPFAALSGRRTPLPLELVTAIPEIPPARAAALAAHLRTGRDETHDTLPRDADYRAALFRKRMLETFLAAGAPPPDWQLFIRNVAVVEQDVHGTAQGVADETFYRPLYRYLARSHPPAQAVAAVDFMHALAAWDFATAARVTDRLRLDAALGEGWLPKDLYRDGSVVAKLMIGDVRGARRFFEALAPVLTDRSSLRAQLLEAHLRAAEATGRR
jgi:spermidine synthase